MRKILTLARLNLTQIRHDRSAIISMTAFPIVLTLLLGLMFGGSSTQPRLPVGFVDLDGSEYSKQFGTLLAENPGYEVQRLGLSKAEDQVGSNKLAAVVIIPQGFGVRVQVAHGASASPAQLEILKSSDPVRTLAVSEVVRGLATRFAADQMAAQTALVELASARESFMATALPTMPAGSPLAGVAVKSLPKPVLAQLAQTFPFFQTEPSRREIFVAADKQWEPTPPISVKLTSVKASQERGQSVVATGFNQYSPGMTVWFVLMLVLGAAGGILEERESGTLARLLTTPTPRAQILGGKVAGIYSVGIVQAAILVGFGALAFNVPWGNAPGAVVLIIGTFTLAATGLAIMVSAIARTRSQAAALAPVLAVSLSMLGGCAWPIDIVPPFMKVIALFTPTGWAMRGLTNVITRDLGFAAALLPSLILTLMAAVFFLVGLWFFKFE